MKRERVVVCSNCESELRYAKPHETQRTISQQYCEYCGYVTIPKIKE
jgi:DNA-directed RNA polymerase subunit RPC12/RpoP